MLSKSEKTNGFQSRKPDLNPTLNLRNPAAFVLPESLVALELSHAILTWIALEVL